MVLEFLQLSQGQYPTEIFDKLYFHELSSFLLKEGYETRSVFRRIKDWSRYRLATYRHVVHLLDFFKERDGVVETDTRELVSFLFRY